MTAVGIVALLVLVGCGPATPGRDSAGEIAVVASFYPLQFATEQIGAGHVAVSSLTRPGAEPHDIELTPQDVATVSEAGLVIYEKGLQAAVDKAVESQASDHALDVAPAAHLDHRLASGTVDPHFWLDPQRYSGVAKAIAARLSVIDPAHKADYTKNARSFEDRLAALSKKFTTSLADCRHRDLVTSHAAFGYLAQRIGMTQVPINGISPDQEPKAAEIATVSAYARTHGVKTIYTETLASPALAATVAREAGARLATLDPIEGLTKQSSGKDYFEIMGANLRTLRAGQECS
jgi:zinc transport system substrate-binding protein